MSDIIGGFENNDGGTGFGELASDGGADAASADDADIVSTIRFSCTVGSAGADVLDEATVASASGAVTTTFVLTSFFGSLFVFAQEFVGTLFDGKPITCIEDACFTMSVMNWSGGHVFLCVVY